jgi:hypothetical protein
MEDDVKMPVSLVEGLEVTTTPDVDVEFRKAVEDFVTSNNYDPSRTPSTEDVGESLTVPDMVMDITEIISRFTRGLPVPQNAAINFDGDLTGFDRMDKLDKEDLRRRMVKRANELQKTLDDAHANHVKDAADAAFNARVDALVEAKLKSNVDPKINQE